MRKLLILAVVALIALAIVPAALAGSGNGPGDGTGTGVCTGAGTGPGGGPVAGGARYSLNGTVSAVGADSVTVTVKSGNRAARTSVSKTVVLRISTATLLYERNVDRSLVTVSLTAFAAGDRVTSVGTMDASDASHPVFTAYRVTIIPPLGTCSGCPN